MVFIVFCTLPGKEIQNRGYVSLWLNICGRKEGNDMKVGCWVWSCSCTHPSIRIKDRNVLSLVGEYMLQERRKGEDKPLGVGCVPVPCRGKA